MDRVAIAERAALTVQVADLFLVREDAQMLAHLAVFVADPFSEARIARHERRERASDIAGIDRRAARASGELTERTMQLYRHLGHEVRSLGSAAHTLATSMKTAFLGDAASRDAQQVGAKAATLSRLADRFRVPAGFCLDTSAFDELGSALEGDRETLATLRALVDAGHRELERLTGRTGPAVAVRSSAIGEDGADSSFAGQHETVLDVRGVDAIVDAVLACWRSASSERAVAYKKERGITERARVAVLVQELVRADAAAIAFSADPRGDRVRDDQPRHVCGAQVGRRDREAHGRRRARGPR